MDRVSYYNKTGPVAIQYINISSAEDPDSFNPIEGKVVKFQTARQLLSIFNKVDQGKYLFLFYQHIVTHFH